MVVGKNCDSTLRAIKDKYKSALGDVDELLLTAYNITAKMSDNPMDNLTDTLKIDYKAEIQRHIPISGSFMAVVLPGMYEFSELNVLFFCFLLCFWVFVVKLVRRSLALCVLVTICWLVLFVSLSIQTFTHFRSKEKHTISSTILT